LKLHIFHTFFLKSSHTLFFCSRTSASPVVIVKLDNYYYPPSLFRKVYTPEIIRDIVEYARVRGVRVLPELDAPAHVGNGWQFGEREGMGRLALCVNQAREHTLPSSRTPMH
jgi:hypothetical protein